MESSKLTHRSNLKFLRPKNILLKRVNSNSPDNFTSIKFTSVIEKGEKFYPSKISFL